MRIEYFEDESFSFLAEQKFHLSLQPHFAEVTQLVEHNLAPKDYKVTTLARGKQHRQTANAKEYNAEVAQLVEHNLAPKDKRFQPWQEESNIGRLRMQKNTTRK